jgi:hypothetical protein
MAQTTFAVQISDGAMFDDVVEVVFAEGGGVVDFLNFE